MAVGGGRTSLILALMYGYNFGMNVPIRSVGVRELRDGLSAHLALVKEGETIVVTEHGKPIAKIVPYEGKSTLEELIDAGIVTPPKKTGRFELPPPIVPTPGPPVSRYIAEEREESLARFFR